MSITNKLQKLQERRSEKNTFYNSVLDSYSLIKSESVQKNFSLEDAYYSEPEIYVINSMKEVGSEYTDKSFMEAERVKNQLLKSGILSVEFDFQGSVTNNTNIRFASDIDLLVVTTEFTTIKPPNKPMNPYIGNPVNELKKIRQQCYQILKESFPTASVDNTGSKSICISGGSLKRDVDVVPCNWVDTVSYSNTLSKIYRGINILDNKNDTRIENLPFLHNFLLEQKDNQVAGHLKPIIRLVKSIKSDMDISPNISSYEICALLYHMEDESILFCTEPKQTLKTISDHFTWLMDNPYELKKLKVPNGTSYIVDSLKISELRSLTIEINSLLMEF